MASASECCSPSSLSLWILFPFSLSLPLSSRFLFWWQGIVALITASGGKKPGKIAARERIIVLVNIVEGGLVAGERSWKKKQLLETRNGRERGREGEGGGRRWVDDSRGETREVGSVLRRRRVLLTWWVSRRRPSWPACTLSSARVSLSAPPSRLPFAPCPLYRSGSSRRTSVFLASRTSLCPPCVEWHSGYTPGLTCPTDALGHPFRPTPATSSVGPGGCLSPWRPNPPRPTPVNQTPVSCPSVHTSLLLVSRCLFASSSNRFLRYAILSSSPRSLSSSKPVVVVLQTAVIVVQVVVPRSSAILPILSYSPLLPSMLSDSFALPSLRYGFRWGI